jgi:hypothetical protein
MTVRIGSAARIRAASVTENAKWNVRRLLSNPRLLLAVYAVGLLLFSIAPHHGGSAWSRLGTIESLVERGGFALTGSRYADTVDKVLIAMRACI